MTRRFIVFVAVVVVLANLAELRATTIVMPTDDQLIERSPVILTGVVTSSDPVERGRGIWTAVGLRVDRVIKGSRIPSEIVVLEQGGSIGNRRTVIFGSPDYKEGERVLVFLWPEADQTFRTMDLFVGKFVERMTIDGRRIWHRLDEAPGTLLLDARHREFDQPEDLRDGVLFEDYIARRSRGEAPARNYVIPSGKTALTTPLAPSFALIDEPEIYRWFRFEDELEVDWVTVGSQPGYDGGGQAELALAFAAWNGYPAARIDYKLAGESTAEAGGLTEPNGLNEIMFADPLDEIPGTWKGGSGVVGRGGFNEVAPSTRTWTSGFEGGPGYPRKAWEAWEITEANLVIQDGVSPSTFFPSYLMAELLAHELGHTLGIGHSDDNESIMRGQLVRKGPELGIDDQNVARWLYPNGPYPDPPQSPTNVRVTEISTRYATIVWEDNADNETYQTIYRAREGGRFERIGRVEADVTSYRTTGTQGITYRVYVNASNDGGTSADSNVVEYAHSAPFDANFTVLPETGIAGMTTFEFTDRSSGKVSDWSWTFGDGWSSNAQNPSHEYDLPGTYTVRLTVSSATGQRSSASRRVTVLSPPTPLKAEFDFSPEDPYAGEAIFFSDMSSGTPTIRLWEFGDGASSAEPSPFHTFASAGDYTVTLDVTDGVTTSRQTRLVSVRHAPQSFRELVPVVASVPGFDETSWLSDLTLFNCGFSHATVHVTLLPSLGSPSASRTFELGAERAETITNVIRWITGLDRGSGAILIEGTNDRYDVDLRVTSRLYTTEGSRTYGQSVASSGDREAGDRFLTGILNSDDYRTNVGFANAGSEPATVTLTLHDAKGRAAGVTRVHIPNQSLVQRSLASLFPEIEKGSSPVYSIRVENRTGETTIYSSVIDNRSQDPVFFLAEAPPTGNVLWVPAVGRTSGTGNTFWRSDLAIFNPGSTSVPVTLQLHASGREESQAKKRWIEVGPSETLRVEDVLSWLGEPAGSGVLEIDWSSEHGPIVSARTYTMREAEDGSRGQSISSVRVSDVTPRAALTGLRSGRAFRTNVGVVNRGDAVAYTTLTLVDSDGSLVGTTTVATAPESQVQTPLEALFSTAGTSGERRWSLRAVSSSPAVVVYASVIDNESGDPIYIIGR